MGRRRVNMAAGWAARRTLAPGLLLAAQLVLAGCDNPPPPTTQPASGPTVSGETVAPGPVAMFDENRSWTAAEAAARLDDEADSVAAAVRLVRLAGAAPLIVPDPLPKRFADRLRVVRLSEFGVWVLGFGVRGQDHLLRSPILLDAQESVVVPAEGPAEELLLLHLSERPEVFPHLALCPDRVWFVTRDADAAEPAGALVLKSPPQVAFALGDRDGFPYVRLVLRGEPQPQEVAEYRWDPYEFLFMGPLIDKLPFPPGGKFELDLNASTGLIPMGGELPEPDPIQPPQQEDPDELSPEWTAAPPDGRGVALQLV